MQLLQHGQPTFLPRTKFTDLYTKPPANPVSPRRIKIIADTAIRGTPVYVGSVFEVDLAHPDFRDDYACLTGSLKAINTPMTTPLVTLLEPAPVVEVAKKKG